MITMCVGAWAASHRPAAEAKSMSRNGTNLRIGIEFYAMRKLIALLSVLCLASASTAQQKDTKLFPYNYTIDDLANGLRLVTVSTDFPNMVPLYFVVQTGPRNEVDPDQSGDGPLFEH